MSGREHDLVVFGATSFVGRILCRHLLDRHGVDGDGPEAVRWAIAARSREKLRALVDELGDGAERLERIVADAHDAADVRRLAESASVVVTTVGPYALHGSPLVAACAEAGTDYVDLSGETPWVRRMLDEHEDAAVGSGARLVPSCGFDSIPSDLGVHVLQGAALERLGVPAVRVRMGVRSLRGGISGGTAASALNILQQLRRQPSLRRVLADPYALCPPEERGGPRQPDLRVPQHDARFGRWVAPFFMAAVNTRVVHRTNALTAHRYGRDFQYDEVVLTGAGPVGAARAVAITSALGAFAGAALTPGLDRVVEQLVPDQGTGPSPEQQRRGRFELRFHGETAHGEVVRATVTGDRDPGYGATGRMLGEAAVCLLRDVDPSVPGGFWTPASLLGDALVERLEAHAGMTFEVD